MKSNDYRWILKLNDYEEMPDIEITLDEVWERIRSQYDKVVGSVETDYILEENSEILERQQTLINLQNMVFYLYYEANEEYINDLKKAGIKITTDETPLEYVESLNAARKTLDGKQGLLNIKREEFKNSLGEVKEVDYMSMVADVSIYLGRNVDIDKESIRFFANCLKSLKSKKHVGSNKKK